MKRTAIFVLAALWLGFLVSAAPASPTRTRAVATVVSDIDDTIKGTHLWAFGVRNFLLNPLALFASRPIPGMPEIYRNWERGGPVEFVYVSAKPETRAHEQNTREFLRLAEFPLGAVFLRPRSSSRFHLLAPPNYKRSRIEPLLLRWLRANPGRRFVLVGDSGEYDPESYGELARDWRFHSHIAAIFIREATHEPRGSTRYAKAFRGLPKSQWHLFSCPSEISGFRP